MGGHTRSDPTPRAPSADLGRPKKIFFGTSPRSNAQGALECGFEGANSRFWGSHGQIQRPGRPSSADLGGQKKKKFWNKPQIQRPGRPRARIWGGKLKILGVAFPDPKSRPPSSADLGGQKKIFWNKPQIQRPGRPRARIWVGGQTIHPLRRIGTEKNILKPQSSAWIWGGQPAPPKSNVQGALERGFGGATESFQSKFPNPTSYLPLCPPQIQGPGRPGARIWGGQPAPPKSKLRTGV